MYDYELIVSEYKRLGTYKKVREKFHCSSATIWKAISKYGIGKGIGGNQDSQRKITDDQILKDIKLGLTRQEIADKHGVHVENLARRMKKLGVHAKHETHSGTPPHTKRFGECWHYVKSQDALFSKLHPAFQYLETRKVKNVKTVRFKCKVCGNIIERAESTVRTKGIQCENCKKIEQEEKELQISRERLLRALRAIDEIKKPKKCIVCDTTFYSQYPYARYCSKECKRDSRKSGIRARCRKYGVYYDNTVTPKKIFKRDKYICGICGMACNVNDKSWGSFGPYSPTVDHIIALANGGPHTWDNVQCAHAICNSWKRDMIIA